MHWRAKIQTSLSSLILGIVEMFWQSHSGSVLALMGGGASRGTLGGFLFFVFRFNFTAALQSSVSPICDPLGVLLDTLSAPVILHPDSMAVGYCFLCSCVFNGVAGGTVNNALHIARGPSPSDVWLLVSK